MLRTDPPSRCAFGRASSSRCASATTATAKPILRSYSIASSPGQPELSLILKLVDGGAASRWFRNARGRRSGALHRADGLFLPRSRARGRRGVRRDRRRHHAGAADDRRAARAPERARPGAPLLGQPLAPRICSGWRSWRRASRASDRLEVRTFFTAEAPAWAGCAAASRQRCSTDLPTLRRPVFYLVGNGAMIRELKARAASSAASIASDRSATKPSSNSAWPRRPVRTSWRSDSSRALSLGTLATLLYLCTAPAVVNLDGLGYLKLLPHNFAAGHLLYMPLLARGDAARRRRPARRPPGQRAPRRHRRGADVQHRSPHARRAAARAPRRSDVRFAATFAAAGLAVSYGYWVQGQRRRGLRDRDGGAALHGAAARSPIARSRRSLRALAAGAASRRRGACPPVHVLLTPFVVAFHLTRTRRRAGEALAAPRSRSRLGGVLAIDSLRLRRVRGAARTIWHGALAWIGTAAARLLLRRRRLSPRRRDLRPRQGDRLVALSLRSRRAEAGRAAPPRPGAARLRSSSALLGRRRARGRARPCARSACLDRALRAPRRSLSSAPIRSAGCSCCRPAVILAAALVRRAAAPGRRALAAPCSLWIGAVQLHHRDLAGASRRVAAAEGGAARAAQLHDGDLVIFPGHSWDEYVGFYGKAQGRAVSRCRTTPRATAPRRLGAARQGDRRGARARRPRLLRARSSTTIPIRAAGRAGRARRRPAEGARPAHRSVHR